MHSGRLNLANAWIDIEHVMQKYLIKHRCGCDQRSNFKTLYDARKGPIRAIVARAQPPGKDIVR